MDEATHFVNNDELGTAWCGAKHQCQTRKIYDVTCRDCLQELIELADHAYCRLNALREGH